MILGRSTLLWTGFIGSVIGFLTVITPMLFPDIPKDNITLVYGGLTIFLGASVTLISGTSTTPTSDPRLDIGQTVNAGLENEGIVVEAAPNAPAINVAPKVKALPAKGVA